MALTLTATLGVPTTLDQAIRLTVTGTVPDAIEAGYQFRLEDEVLELKYFEKAQQTILGGAATQTVDDRNVWYAQRGVAGTAIVSHAATTVVEGVADALLSGTTETVPVPPFGTGGEAGPHSTTHEDQGDDEVRTRVTDTVENVEATEIEFVFAPSAALRATVHLEAADILTLFSVPVQLLPAPGANKVLVLTRRDVEFVPGLVTYHGAETGAIAYDGDMTDAVLVLGGTPEPIDEQIVATYQAFVLSGTVLGTDQGMSGGKLARDLIVNKPLLISAVMDPPIGGPIVTHTLDDGGSGYAPGDTGTITGTYGLIVGVAAEYVVDTVDGGGAVLTYHLSEAGTSDYDTASNPRPTSVLTGGGDGLFSVNVTEIPPADGEAWITAWYTIEDLH